MSENNDYYNYLFVKLQCELLAGIVCCGVLIDCWSGYLYLDTPNTHKNGVARNLTSS